MTKNQTFVPSPDWLKNLYPGRDGYTDLLLAAWRAKNPRKEMWAVPIFAHANYLARILEGMHSEVLKPLGLNYSDYALLITLRLIVGGEGAQPSELNRVLLQTSAGMTLTIKRLEKAKLLKRRPNPLDRRSIVVALSRRGERKADEASELLAEKLYGKLDVLGSDTSRNLLRVLDQLVQAVQPE